MPQNSHMATPLAFKEELRPLAKRWNMLDKSTQRCLNNRMGESHSIKFKVPFDCVGTCVGLGDCVLFILFLAPAKIDAEYIVAFTHRHGAANP